MEDEKGRHVYLQCKKNHSATLGTYAVDGCEEFLASDAPRPSNGELLCSACGCDRSFHHKVPARYASPPPPLPIAPLALVLMPATTEERAVRTWRRVRTKFSAEQKERMGSFAERLGWRIPKREREEELERFLEETGVSRRAFKVWMHNHRNAAAKVQAAKDSSATDTDNGATVAAASVAAAGVGGDGEAEDDGHENAAAAAS